MYTLLRYEHVTFNIMSLLVLILKGLCVLLYFEWQKCYKHICIYTVVQPKTLTRIPTPTSPSKKWLCQINVCGDWPVEHFFPRKNSITDQIIYAMKDYNIKY